MRIDRVETERMSPLPPAEDSKILGSHTHEHPADCQHKATERRTGFCENKSTELNVSVEKNVLIRMTSRVGTNGQCFWSACIHEGKTPA